MFVRILEKTNSIKNTFHILLVYNQLSFAATRCVGHVFQLTVARKAKNEKMPRAMFVHYHSAEWKLRQPVSLQVYA